MYKQILIILDHKDIFMTFRENWYSTQQAHHIAELATTMRDKGMCMEIGCWEGFSTYYIANAIYPTQLLCVDTWQGSIAENVNHVSVIEAEKRDVYRQFRDNMQALTKGNYLTFVYDWRGIIPILKGAGYEFSFVHIDAEHDYQSVYDCIEMLYPLMVHGGIMCGDDFTSANIARTDLGGGVEKAVRDFFGAKGIEIHSANNAWWIYVNESI